MALKTKILLLFAIAMVATAGMLSGWVGDALVGIVWLQGMLLFCGLLIVFFHKKTGVVVPSTELERLERERAMLAEQLSHARKMEAVGHLAGSIAHDFNNLLTIIDGYSSLILAHPESDETERHAQEVIEAARKASFITRKLLNLGQRDPQEPVCIDLNTALTDADAMLSRLLGETVQLVVQVPHEPIRVAVDPVRLGQVLMNLSANARDAMPHGGCITIRSSVEEVADGKYGKPDRLSAGDYARISVHDSGLGIEPETVGRIFEPFFTTKDSGEGTGLGLALVKTIVKQSGGFIDLSSQLGEGTTFMIYLPLAGATEEAPVVLPEEPAQALEPSGNTLLLVEDDPMIRELVVHILEGESYTVLVAHDGWEAVQCARKHTGKIDLLFTDVVMPGLGGPELALAIRELYPHIKVLFMSGHSRAQLAEEGVPPDAELIEKPFTPDQVLAGVRKAFAR